MKKYIFVCLVGLLSFSACDDPDPIIFDGNEGVNNGTVFASFEIDNAPAIIYNPAADTPNIYPVGVSTVSDVDRSVTVEVDPESTIDPMSYSAQLTAVIPAGSVSADIVITTFASDVFPAPGSTLMLNLVSVQGAEINANIGTSSYSLPFTVECPSVDISGIVGTATTTANELLVAVGSTDGGADPRTVVAGPGENQVTIVGGLGLGTSDDIILNVDPVSGNLSDGASGDTVLFVNNGTPILLTGITGRSLTCINQITFEAANANFGGDFAAFTLTLRVAP